MSLPGNEPRNVIEAMANPLDRQIWRGMGKGDGPFAAGATAIANFLGGLGMPADVIIRHEHGHAWLSGLRFFLALLTQGGYVIAMAMLKLPFSWFLLAVLLAFPVLFLYHSERIQRRKYEGRDWISTSPGRSHLVPLAEAWNDGLRNGSLHLSPYLVFRLSIDDQKLLRIVEPFAVALLAVPLWPVDRVFAIWLLAVGLGLFIRNTIHATEQERIIDIANDARILNENYQAARLGRPLTETAGVSAPVMSDKERAEFERGWTPQKEEGGAGAHRSAAD